MELLNVFARARRKERRLVTIEAGDFLCRAFPPREAIIFPWLTKQGLAMIHAPRGIGKTFLSLGIAHAVATGGRLLKWQAPKPRGVLFVDGEMPATALQARLKDMVEQTGESTGNNLHIITPDLQEDGIPDLGTTEGQEAIWAAIGPDIELVILDNLSCLVYSGNENEADGWGALQQFLLKLRRRGIAVLYIHHSGKSGGQRGTSRREDVLDTVIKLERPPSYTASEGAVFKIAFEKARHFYGESAEEFIAQYRGGGASGPWAILENENDLVEKVLRLSQDGKLQKDIAKEVGKSEPTVSRILKAARENGRIREPAFKNSVSAFTT